MSEKGLLIGHLLLQNEYAGSKDGQKFSLLMSPYSFIKVKARISIIKLIAGHEIFKVMGLKCSVQLSHLRINLEPCSLSSTRPFMCCSATNYCLSALYL